VGGTAAPDVRVLTGGIWRWRARAREALAAPACDGGQDRDSVPPGGM